MEPKHLMQLAVILEKGSITAAAKHLHLTQPTLTRNMHTLEMQADGVLFTRSRFGVRSTRLGGNLARDGRAIARQIQSAMQSASRNKLGFYNQLKVGVGPLIGMAAVPLISERLAKDFPETALTVYCDRPQHLLEQMVEGDFDIVMSPAIHTKTPQGFARNLLIEDQLGVFCGKKHPLAIRGSFQPHELEACEWMVIGTTSPFHNKELEFLQNMGVDRVSTQFSTVNDAIILLNVLMQGRHLAVLPRQSVKLMNDTHPLVEVPITCKPSIRNLYFWYREELAENAAVQAFGEIALEIMSSADNR